MTGAACGKTVVVTGGCEYGGHKGIHKGGRDSRGVRISQWRKRAQKSNRDNKSLINRRDRA